MIFCSVYMCIWYSSFCKFQDKCLRKTCPPRSVLDNVTGDCNQVLIKTRFASYEYRLKLKPVGIGEMPDEQDLFDTFEDFLNISSPEDKICTKEVDGIEDYLLVFRLRVIIKKPSLIDPKTLFEDFKTKIAENNKSLNRLFDAELDTAVIHALPLGAMTYFSFESEMDTCSNAVALSEIQFCDGVLFSSTEYKLNTETRELKIGQHIFKEGEYVFRTDSLSNETDAFVHVCLDKYIISETEFVNQKHAYKISTLGKQDKLLPELAVNVLTFACTLASIMSLLLLIIVYILLKFYKATPTLNTLMLAVNLLIAQCLFQFGNTQTDTTWVCHIIGIATHYFWLVYMSWASVCTFNVFQTFVLKLMTMQNEELEPSFLKNFVFGYAIPIPFVIANILYSCLTGDNMGYGPKTCYISTPVMIGFTFALPFGLLVLVNLILFVIFTIRLRSVGHEFAKRYPKRKITIDKIQVYLRISSLTGISWSFAFLYMWTGVEWIEYIFLILNSSNGVFIAVSFLTNDGILNKIKQQIRNLRCFDFFRTQ